MAISYCRYISDNRYLIGSYWFVSVPGLNINFLASSREEITSLINYTTTMVHNYISNDIDLVQPIQYPLSKSRVAKKPPPAPRPLSSFELLSMFNNCEYSKPNLPEYIDNKDPWQLFKLFWNDELVN